jgi:hypothetical protein
MVKGLTRGAALLALFALTISCTNAAVFNAAFITTDAWSPAAASYNCFAAKCDLPCGQAPVDLPAAPLSGPLTYVPTMFGPVVPAANLTARLVVVQGDPCTFTFQSSPVQSLDLDGNPAYNGSIVLFVGSPGCTFGTVLRVFASLGASAVVYPTACGARLDNYILSDASETYPIPGITIAAADAWRLAFTIFPGFSANNGAAAGNNASTPVYLTLLGSGPLEPSEKTALMQLYSVMSNAGANPWSFGPSSPPESDRSGGLLSWSLLLTDFANNDPCLNRMFGLWCVGGRVVWMNLFGQQIRGGLSTHIGSFPQLVTLALGANAITSLPCEIGLLQNLQILSVAQNQLTSLPTCVGQLKSLSVFEAHGNQLTSLPLEVSEWKALTFLDVSSNKLVSMPNVFSCTGIQSLLLYNNKIGSSFFNPANLTKLKVYDIHDNAFFGQIPVNAFNQLGGLTTINVASNALTGALPAISGSSEITSLTFAFNAFSGTVPGTWSALAKLVSVDLSRNQV